MFIFENVGRKTNEKQTNSFFFVAIARNTNRILWLDNLKAAERHSKKGTHTVFFSVFQQCIGCACRTVCVVRRLAIISNRKSCSYNKSRTERKKYEKFQAIEIFLFPLNELIAQTHTHFRTHSWLKMSVSVPEWSFHSLLCVILCWIQFQSYIMRVWFAFDFCKNRTEAEFQKGQTANQHINVRFGHNAEERRKWGSFLLMITNNKIHMKFFQINAFGVRNVHTFCLVRFALGFHIPMNKKHKIFAHENIQS